MYKLQGPGFRGCPTVDFMQIRMLKTKDLQAHFSPKYQPLDGLFSPDKLIFSCAIGSRKAG
jgi:hypothetical protein